MDVNNLIRDKDIVFECMQGVNNQLIALKPLKIYVPERYLHIQPLAKIEEKVTILAIFGIVFDDRYYAVSKGCTLIQTVPNTINIVTIEDEKYLELQYDKGDILIFDTYPVRIGTLVYRINNEILSNGNIPWYLDHDDLGTIYETALSLAKVNFKVDNAIKEMLVAGMARWPEDPIKLYRHMAKTKEIVKKTKPIFIGQSSVAYMTTNTTSKLMGSYLNEGLTSALVTPSENNEIIEDLLRGASV